MLSVCLSKSRKQTDIQGVSAVLNVLNSVEKTARETPPIDNAASRFGNPAFRTFYDKIQEVSSFSHSQSLQYILCRHQVNSIYLCQISLCMPFLKYLFTSMNVGETEHGLTMEAAWS